MARHPGKRSCDHLVTQPSTLFPIIIAFTCLSVSFDAIADQIEVVGRDESTLSEVAIRLYGKALYWKKIVDWNQLTPPYHILPGQRLVLKEKPLLTEEQGSAALLAMWRNRLSSHVAVSESPAPRIERTEVSAEQEQTEYEQAKIIAERPSRDGDDGEFVDEEKTAERCFALGQSAFRAGNAEKALAEFRASREKKPEDLPAWILEIKILKTLGRAAEFDRTVSLFIEKHPEMRHLPLLKTDGVSDGH